MSPLVRYRLAGLGLLAVVLVVIAAALGAVDLEEQSMLDALDAPVYAVEPPAPAIGAGPAGGTAVLSAAGVSVEPTVPSTVSPPTSSTAQLVVVPDAPAARLGNATQITPTEPPPPPTLPPTPAPGDCTGWGEVLAWYGATADEVAFFVPRILDRETGCGRDTLNDSTGDSGICQINPVHNRDGWFGGREFGSGGWLAELHGLTTRVDTDSVAWAAACITLHRVCGTGPWRPPYSCANRPLP